MVAAQLKDAGTEEAEEHIENRSNWKSGQNIWIFESDDRLICEETRQMNDYLYQSILSGDK